MNLFFFNINDDLNWKKSNFRKSRSIFEKKSFRSILSPCVGYHHTSGECFPNFETNYFFLVYFELTTKLKKFYSDSNTSFSKQKWIQSCAKAFNFCRGKKTCLAHVYSSGSTQMRSFSYFNLLGQNQSCKLYSACILICKEAPLPGSSWVVWY